MITTLTSLFLCIGEEVIADRTAEGHQVVSISIYLIHWMTGKFRVGIADEGIALLHQPQAILVGNTEEFAQHTHWQLSGDIGNKVELAFLSHLVDDSPGEQANTILKCGHLAWSKRRSDQTTVLSVLWRVHLHQRSAGVQFLSGHFLKTNARGTGEQARVEVDS